MQLVFTNVLYNIEMLTTQIYSVWLKKHSLMHVSSCSISFFESYISRGDKCGNYRNTGKAGGKKIKGVFVEYILEGRAFTEDPFHRLHDRLSGSNFALLHICN